MSGSFNKPPFPSFILDASVVSAWLFPDEQQEYALQVYSSLQKIYAGAPALIMLEIGNAFMQAEKRGRIGAEKTHAFMQEIMTLPSIELDYTAYGEATEAILSLARDHQLTVYDAVYLELALRHQLPLATLDKDLAKAAKKCGVEIFRP